RSQRTSPVPGHVRKGGRKLNLYQLEKPVKRKVLASRAPEVRVAGAPAGGQQDTARGPAQIVSSHFEPVRFLARLIGTGEQGDIMNKLCRIATVAAIVVAASAFATEASANPFAWLGYSQTDNGNQVRADLRRVTVEYPTNEAPGTIVVDTGNTYLYYVLGGGKAIRYAIGVD